MRLTSERNPDGAVVTAAGRLTTSQVGRLHRLLLEAFEGSSRVELTLRDIQEVDLSFLQLLCSAHRTAAARGAVFLLSGVECAGPLLHLVNEAGAERDAGCPEGCVWPAAAAADAGRAGRQQG